MFFPKLRARAKWVFVLLAVAFGGGFIIFGVGSNLPSGLGDILQDVSRNSTPSVGDARDRVEDNPRDPEAQLALADALQQNQRVDEAIAPLEAYIKLRPRDEDALRELAGLYSSKANRLEGETDLAAIAWQAAATGQLVQPKLPGAAGEGLFQPPAIEAAITNDAQERYNKLLEQNRAASKNAQRIYERIVRLDPRDPQVQALLASSAQRAGDPAAAIAAYKRFLKLAPEDSSADAVRRAIRDLEKQTGSGATQP